MIKNLNETVLEKILTVIPDNIKPVNYLMDVLDLGKESAYRRLRGEKAFSFEEISTLAADLGFSLDEIVQKNKMNTAIFNYVGGPDVKPEEGMLEFLQYYESYLNLVNDDGDSKIIVTMNHLFYSTILRYNSLFKFTYYRWIHQMKRVPLNYLYADIVIDSRILDVRSRIIGREYLLKNIAYIIDNTLFLNMIKEIQYFFRRGLVTADELEMIKKDFLTFMTDLEKTLTRGIDQNGNVNEIYLSLFNIDSNTIYTESDGKVESSFWVCYGHPIKTTNSEITARHKHWLDSLRKYTTVISSSNELVQADFFNQQREYINGIAGNNWL